MTHWIIKCVALCAMMVVASACSATMQQVIPTDLPTYTPTITPSATHMPARNVTPTRYPTQATRAVSVTPLLAITQPPRVDATSTPTPNPNLARIEFFASDVASVERGGTVTLFWSARNVENAVIYRLGADGTRQQVWNVAPDSSLVVEVGRDDRGELAFLLVAGEADTYNEAHLTIPIRCSISWFFDPSPPVCPASEAVETIVTEQTFERGRMVYIHQQNQVLVLFNDGEQPAWVSFMSDYNLGPTLDMSPPDGLLQPVHELGYVWRTHDAVRSRLGFAIVDERTFYGVYQVSLADGEGGDLFVTTGERTILQAVLGGDVWYVLSP